MIMVLLGVYTSVLTAISSFNIPVLIPVALGVLLGVFWGAKLIDWCMKRFEQQTYFAILGLIAGSILPILLNAGYTPGLHTLLSLIALIAAPHRLLDEQDGWASKIKPLNISTFWTGGEKRTCPFVLRDKRI